MKLVRIDQVAPGGTTLDLHPRMTVLVGASPEMRRRLISVFQSLVGDGAPEPGGLIEVSGVRLGLDRATLDQLRLDPEIAPVIHLGDPSERTHWSSSATPTSTAARGADGADAGSTPDLGGAARERELAELRDRLRAVGSERTALGRRMEVARSGLDSFSTAALEVCVGQIDALESRRSSLRAEWETARSRHVAERESVADSAARHAEWIERVGAIDPTTIQTARDALSRLLEPPTELDPEAILLADRLEAVMQVARELSGRQANLEIRQSEANQRLQEANEEARSAERLMRSPVFDPDVVRRLEQVRDEIFSVDDRQGRLGAARNKRKVSELRAEEAILLDRLGFDTYSAYVMGIPSVRAELERSSRLESAQDRTDRIAEELERLRSEAPDQRQIERSADELADVLTRSLEYLGDPRAARVGALVIDGPPGAGQVADIVYETISELRRRRLVALSDDSPPILVAIDRLRRAIQDSVIGWPSTTSPSGPSVPPFPIDALPAAPRELLSVADAWVEWHRDLELSLGAARRRAAELAHELETIDDAPDGTVDMTRWAEVEAELDSALDRLSVAEERVRGHEAAMATLAQLREEELDLRESERELLSAIARLERPTAVPSATSSTTSTTSGTASTDEPGPAPSGAPAPPPYRGTTTTGTAASTTTDSGDSSPDIEWALIARLAEQRSVSFAGSVPLLVDGLPKDKALSIELLERMDRMSDQVQVVVVATDSSAEDWVRHDGSRVAVHSF